MNRRQFLHATGTAGIVATTGCLGTLSARQPEATPPPDRPDGFWRWVNLVDIDPPPEEYEVGFDVEITQPWVTAERTARIEATLTNEADVKRNLDPALLYSRESENKGIRVWITPNTVPNPEPWCTGGDGIKANPGGESGEQPPSRALEPGESYKTGGYVVDDAEVRGCYPPGVYQFPTTQSVTEYGASEDTEGESYEVSFSLGVQGNNN